MTILYVEEDITNCDCEENGCDCEESCDCICECEECDPWDTTMCACGGNCGCGAQT